MIPLRLHIKNFLSYGAPVQTINFEPYHLICLSGKNGHGKSALLDAITWSLWGQARKAINVHKADDALVRLGQTHMMVALDFICNGEIYRVRREYTLKGSKGTVSLDIGIKNRTTGALQQLTEKTVRDTQATINRIIGLDHEAFENSAFLRQGQSDAFSRQTPQDRKETLSHILGIGLYEQLRKQVAEKNKIEQSIHKEIQHTCTLLAQDAERYTHYAHELQELRTTLEHHMSSINRAQENHTGTTRLLKTLRVEQESIAPAIMRMRYLTTQQDALTNKLDETRAAWRSLHTQHIRSAPIPTAARTREAILTDLAALTTISEQRLAITTQLTRKKEQLQIYQHESARMVDQRLHALKQTIAQQQTRADATRVRIAENSSELDQLHKRYQQLHEAIARIDTLLEERADISEQLQRQNTILEQKRNRLQRSINHHHRIDHQRMTTEQLLAAMGDDTGLQCTLCLQPVSAAERAQIMATNRALIQRLGHQQRRIERCIAHYQSSLATMHQTIHTLQSQEHILTQKAHEKQLLVNQLHAAEEERGRKITTIATLTHEVTAIESALQRAEQELLDQVAAAAHTDTTDSRSIELTRAITEITATLAALPEPTYAYQELHNELHALTMIEQQKREQEELYQQKRLLLQRVHELITEIRSIRAEAAALVAIEERSITIQVQIEAAEAEEIRLRTEIAALISQKEQLVQRVGALEQATAHSAQQAVALSNEQHKLRQTEQNINDYTILAQALSKDGIQGMLIEHILPDLEQEANRLLSKLTDNQAHLRFESVKELKGGGSKETLDIKISDALGVRPYEFFSGGEAFRIDFALRLAIAKLLARRAGASLQTLIIDEGFGSQDEEGLHAIMESLYAIQSEFAKIIIVSHLPSMKDQFPVHFHVYKSAQGSKVQILEQQ